jgi:hypothetical protein
LLIWRTDIGIWRGAFKGRSLFGKIVAHPTEKPAGLACQRVLMTVKAAPKPSVTYFQRRYEETDCRTHEQSIIDWEFVAPEQRYQGRQ